MNSIDVTFVEFGAEHLDGAVALSRQAGWPHRLEDWAMLLGLSRGFVALEESRVVGTIMLTPFGQAATINMVIVDASMRGKGLGARLMRLALDKAGGRECRLVATEEGLPLYRKLGFREVATIRQHQGLVLPIEAAGHVTWTTADFTAEIAALDRRATGMDRGALLEALQQVALFAVIRLPGGIAGYAAIRRFGRGEVIGPVVARDAGDARHLVSFLLSERTGAFIRVDTPRELGLGDWLTGLGLKDVGGGIAMRRSDASTLNDDDGVRVYALASQALG
ncbi:MAG TPA: GNAT family N-acetyltransferase [Pseudolabrys sp.]|nr:GNAT family N-acetyltransferase [Pseudolabrys sp.]